MRAAWAIGPPPWEHQPSLKGVIQAAGILFWWPWPDAEAARKRVQATPVCSQSWSRDDGGDEANQATVPVVLNAPTKSRTFLAVVDQALAYRSGSGQTGKPASDGGMDLVRWRHIPAPVFAFAAFFAIASSAVPQLG